MRRPFGQPFARGVRSDFRSISASSARRPTCVSIWFLLYETHVARFSQGCSSDRENDQKCSVLATQIDPSLSGKATSSGQVRAEYAVRPYAEAKRSFLASTSAAERTQHEDRCQTTTKGARPPTRPLMVIYAGIYIHILTYNTRRRSGGLEARTLKLRLRRAPSALRPPLFAPL